MKKFYPEDYFRRSGYAFEPAKDKKKKDLVYFKTKQSKNDAEFNRFNEELVYPKADSKIGGDAKSKISRYDLDRLSGISRKSKTSLGDALAGKSQRSRLSSAKYIRRDAQSITSRLKQQRK